MFTPVNSDNPEHHFAQRRILVFQQHGRFEAALDLQLALGAALDAIPRALAILDEILPVRLIEGQFVAVDGNGVHRGFLDGVELFPNAAFFVVGELAIHHRTTNELGVLPNLLRDRIIRRKFVQPAGDDFHFGVALLVAEPIEFLNHLSDLLLHLDFHFAIAVPLGQNGFVLLIQLDFGLMIVRVFFGLVERDFDAAQQLAACGFGQLRIVHQLLSFVQRGDRAFRILFLQSLRFGLALADLGRELARQRLLIGVGRIDERGLGLRGGRSLDQRRLVGFGCRISGYWLRQLLGRRRCGRWCWVRCNSVGRIGALSGGPAIRFGPSPAGCTIGGSDGAADAARLGGGAIEAVGADVMRFDAGGIASVAGSCLVRLPSSR